MQDRPVAFGAESTAPFPFSRLTDTVPGGIWSGHFQRSVLVIGAENTPWDGLIPATGCRLLDVVPVNQGAARLAMTVDVDVIILSCRGDEPGLESLVARMDAMALNGGTDVIILVGLAGLDMVYASVRTPGAIILCDADAQDIAAAFCAVLRRRGNGQWLHDISRENEGERLERLTDELARLARTIEDLVQDRTPVEGMVGKGNSGRARGDTALFRSPANDFSAFPLPDFNENAPEPIDAQQVRALLRARRLRDHIFSSELFADPAWDIMLDLMAAQLEGTQVSVSSLCIAAAVPPTTALRWIRQLTDRGLLVRQADPGDGRRVFITLSEEGTKAVHHWFAASRTHLLSASGEGTA
ncbi:winged helix DNA-binding protein [Sphingobium subterraneum]|uniref:DNA-binding MarR family transcriptional regulator n=1 Tax=Sphingobium subterraneum TaxID=627688 RepID=A0A841IYJ1_9SPHN|nr:winged helix DNA-binding protein [Sphingobium subterraneum]MBB6123202.1 DNA-binding MarR family transcriptional regulator [Sphingobium subterraneum]